MGFIESKLNQEKKKRNENVCKTEVMPTIYRNNSKRNVFKIEAILTQNNRNARRVLQNESPGRQSDASPMHEGFSPDYHFDR